MGIPLCLAYRQVLGGNRNPDKIPVFLVVDGRLSGPHRAESSRHLWSSPEKHSASLGKENPQNLSARSMVLPDDPGLTVDPPGFDQLPELAMADGLLHSGWPSAHTSRE